MDEEEVVREEPHCGHPGERRVVDPFIREIYNEEVWSWLCEDCELDRALDV